MIMALVWSVTEKAIFPILVTDAQDLDFKTHRVCAVVAQVTVRGAVERDGYVPSLYAVGSRRATGYGVYYEAR